MKKIIIGTRGSKLSQAYASKVRNLISQNIKDIELSIKTIKTSGDSNQKVKISEIGGKNLFCKEIEENLLDKKIDVAVHSLKDMESQENDKLIIGAFVERNDPRETIISDKIKKLSELGKVVKIGSSSRRREFQLKKINKEIIVENMRGNIDTRIKKLESNEFDGIILALAGVKTLNFEKKIGFVLETNEMLPAVGQGIIAVQCRKNDAFVLNILKKINDKQTNLCAVAERKMLKTIGGNCETAIGALAEIENNTLKLKAQLFSDEGDESFFYELTGPKTDALNIGEAVGNKLLDLAGEKFFKR